MATAPLRGESRVDLLPGLRHLALDRAVYWFRPRAEQRDIQAIAVMLYASIILTTARQHQARLFSMDADFKGLADVELILKMC